MHFKKSIILPVVFICLWALVQYFFARPESIVDDWNGWRQADTQTIARNYLKPNSNIFYPQINWGGIGPGYVESEFQLYTMIIALIMKYTGEAVWPGQVLNILIFALSFYVLYGMLKEYFGEGAGLFGAAVFITNNGPVHLSTSIQPDALCFLFYTLGLSFFLKCLRNYKHIDFILMAICTTLAALIKPLALNLLIIQFCFLCFIKSYLLKEAAIWLGWGVIVVITAAHLAFSYNLYLTYGNTFGVIGGDSKFPTIQGLACLINYPKLVYMTIAWGLGPLGAIAGLYLIIKRKLTPIEWALVAGNFAAIVIPMRYTVSREWGAHYYIYTAILGAWFLAHAFQYLQQKFFEKYCRIVVIICVILIFINYAISVYNRINPLTAHYNPAVTKLGYVLKNIAKREDLIIVRSVSAEHEHKVWGTRANNYEDPRVFYIANVRGWVIPKDRYGSNLIEKYAQSGAKYFVELFNHPDDPELNQWLNENATVVYNDKNGRIYKLEIKTI